MLHRNRSPFRKRQFLSQALRNHLPAYMDLTVRDGKAAPDLTVVILTFAQFGTNARFWWTRFSHRPAPVSSRIDAPAPPST